MPELVASLCTLLVLAPLALMPGMGQFLFRPLAMAVAFAMGSAYLLSRSFVPSRAALWLKGYQQTHGEEHATETPQRRPGLVRRGFDRIQDGIEFVIQWYVRGLNHVLRLRWFVVLGAAGLLAAVLGGLLPHLRRDFFPEVDAGAFEIYVRLNTGTRIEETEKEVAEVENLIRQRDRQRSGADNQPVGRLGRLVRRLHSQLRADGRRALGATQNGAGALRSALRRRPAQAPWPKTTVSPPWRFRSIRAAPSAAP